jgi:hypothetical protein
LLVKLSFQTSMHVDWVQQQWSILTSSNWLGVYALAPLLKETCRSAEGSSMPSGGAAAAPAAAAADSLPCGGVVCLRKPAAGGAGAGAFAALLLRSTPCGRLLLLLGALPSC